MRITFIISLVFTQLVISSSVFAKTAQYPLGIVLVVDQFRADYLMRFQDEFLPSSAKGYRFLMEKGAYFPLADHGLLQNMTGPGHAGILTGSFPYRNHISINWWFDRELDQEQYCVQDNSVKIIGSGGVVTNARFGVSPRSLNATTIGDELKNVDRPSRVLSIALKDRAAILLGGKRADHVFWFDDQNCQWVTSEFYEKKLPEFVIRQNSSLTPKKNESFSWGPYSDMKYCSKESLQTPWAIEETLNFALKTFEEYHLGKGKDTDLLLISLSSHDYLGHRLGPNDPNMKKITLEEDRMISKFLNQISAKLPHGMQDLFLVLTGDHGIPPHPKHLPLEKISSENVSEKETLQVIEETLTREFGKPKGGKWIRAMVEFQVYFNQEALQSAGITSARAVEACRKKILEMRHIDQVWSRDEILFQRKSPAGEYGVLADRTLSFRSGDMILVLKPFFYSDSYPLTHMTPYSYDRYVPLIFLGKTFKPGLYRQIVNIVDIAPTLSSTLGVIPPSQSEGRILTEILR